MFFYDGYICPVCKQKFDSNDDIVACPECGAPHHRECWKQEGHCHFSADHGTQRQWKRQDETAYTAAEPSYNSSAAQNDSVKYCTNCGQQNPEYAEFCSRCGQKLNSPEWSSNNNQSTTAGYSSNYSQFPYNKAPYSGSYGEYTPFHIPIFDPYGGIPHDEKIQDVTTEELVAYVGSNSAYYIPRFFKMSRTGSHTSWNWPAFLFTSCWLLYRKNYITGSIMLFLSIIQTFISNFILGYYILPQLDTSSNAAMYQSLDTLIQSGNSSIYLNIISLLFFSTLIIKIIFGLIGNALYMNTSLSRIRKIRKNMYQNDSQQSTAYHIKLASEGGVSLVLVAVASVIIWFGNVLFQALFISI